MVDGLDNQTLALFVWQYSVQSEFYVLAFVDVRQVGAHGVVVRINALKKVVKALHNFVVGFFERLVKLNQIHGVLDAFVEYLLVVVLEVLKVVENGKILQLLWEPKFYFLGVKHSSLGIVVVGFFCFDVYDSLEQKNIWDVVAESEKLCEYRAAIWADDECCLVAVWL